jgi:hypothetical protein
MAETTKEEIESRQLLFGAVVQTFINSGVAGIELNKVQSSIRPPNPVKFVRDNYPGIKYIVKENKHYLVNTAQYKKQVDEAAGRTAKLIIEVQVQSYNGEEEEVAALTQIRDAVDAVVALCEVSVGTFVKTHIQSSWED